MPDMDVSYLTQQCLDRFHEAIASANDTNYQDILKNRLASFDLWKDSVGAMATTGASLDSRFRSRPDDLEFVKNILRQFSDFLEEFKDIANDGLPKFEALVGIDSGIDSAIINKGHPIINIIAHMNDAIKSLAEIGVAIRRTGKASRSRRANQSFNPDEHHDFKRHLECLVLLRPNENQSQAAKKNGHIGSIPAESNEKNEKLRAKPEQLAKSRMEEIDFSKLNDLQKRLIGANLRRRHNFLVAQKHSQRVKSMTQYKTPGERQKQDTAPVEVAGNIPTAHGSSNAKIPTPLNCEDQPIKNDTPLTTTGYTTASTAEGALEFGLARGQHHAPTTTCSQISSIAANTEFPLPPSVPRHQLVGKCPCCCQSLPSGDFKSPKKWRQHLIEDLCPYTCIAKSCPTPDMLFTTKKAWELHIENDHPLQWQCSLCDEENEAFSSEEDITSHTLTQHKEELSEYELSYLISSAKVQDLGIKSCPLCSSHGPRDAPELVDHVVRHAYEFALRALPWPQSIMENLNKPIGTYSLPEDTFDAKRLENWLLSLQESGKLAVSSFDKMDHALREISDNAPAEDYFANNDYFEEEKSADSFKCQTDHTRSSIVRSELSSRDLDTQNVPADSTQFAVELNAAVTRGDDKAVRNLLEDYHALDDGDEIKTKALIAAVQGGHIAVIQQLLKSGIDINSQDDHGRTILFYAIQRKDKSMAEYFVRMGIDVNIKDNAGLTALQMAIRKGDNEIISTIFTPAVYQKSRDDKGDRVQEVISWAKEQRHPSAAKVLSELRTRYESILSRAQKTFNIEDRTAAAQSIINGNDWFALIDPLLEPVYLDLMGVLPHKDRVLRVAFSPDGKYIVTGSWDGSVNIFDVETKQTVFQIVLSQGLPAFDVCFSPDGQSIATTSDKLIQVWDIKKKKIQRSFEHDRVCDALDFSNDGRFLASSDRGSTVHIWGLEKGVSSRKFTVSNDAITRIQISPDSCHVVAGTYFGSVSIWNLKTNTLERKLQHGHNVKSIVFSSDGKHIATGGTPLFKVWELGTGDCLSDFGVPGSRAVSVSITPDDRWTIIAPEDRSIQFWDRTTGRSHRIIDAHAAITRSVAFRPQGGYFATASDDKTVRIWSYGPHRTP